MNAFPYRQVKESDTAKVRLEVKQLANNAISGINFDLKEGEILGNAGLVGSGRTEIARALIGADPAKNKDVMINGKKAVIKNPTDALAHGICLIPESRKTQGLVLSTTIKNNISLPILKDLSNKFKLINQKKENDVVNQSIKDLLIKTPSSKEIVKNLSGGNQQKVVLAKWLNTDSNILIFDEPTRGIDIGAKEEIYKLIRNLADEGISIIMISSELPEILGMCDRVLVMHKGKMQTIMDGTSATQENIMHYATGGVGK